MALIPFAVRIELYARRWSCWLSLVRSARSVAASSMPTRLTGCVRGHRADIELSKAGSEEDGIAGCSRFLPFAFRARVHREDDSTAFKGVAVQKQTLDRCLLLCESACHVTLSRGVRGDFDSGQILS